MFKHRNARGRGNRFVEILDDCTIDHSSLIKQLYCAERKHHLFYSLCEQLCAICQDESIFVDAANFQRYCYALSIIFKFVRCRAIHALQQRVPQRRYKCAETKQILLFCWRQQMATILPKRIVQLLFSSSVFVRDIFRNQIAKALQNV